MQDILVNSLMNAPKLALGLAPIKSWFSSEGVNAVSIGVIIFGVVYLFKQELSKSIGLLLFGGFVFFLARSPEKVLGAIGEFVGKMF